MFTNNEEKFFHKRSGTTNKGYKYEDIITSKLSLELAINDEVQNFYLSSNDKDFGSFEDVVLEVLHKHQISSTYYAIQLKHLNANKIISKNMLAAETGDFSIEIYFQFFKQIKNKYSDISKIKFLLYTNGNFDCKPTFKMKNFTVMVEKVNISTGDVFMFNTSENSSVFQFRIEKIDSTSKEGDDEIDEYKEFFKQFFFYSNQKNVDELKITLLKNFQETYYTDETSFNTYTDFIIKWSEAEGRKICLRKQTIKLKIAEILLKPFILPASETSLDFSKYQLFKETCVQYDIISFRTNEENIIKQIKKLFSEENIQIDKTIIVKRFFPETRDLNKVEEETKFLILWHMNALPLVLLAKKDNQAIVNLAINLCSEDHGLERKFFLVGENIVQENLKQVKTFQTLNDLPFDSDFLQEFIHNNKVTIQGRHILLEKLITTNEEIKEIITPVEVMKIINGNLTIGEDKEQLPDPYIDQFLSSPFTELRYLDEKNENVVPVISCCHRMNKNLKTKFFRKFVTVEEYMKNDKDNVNSSLQNVIIGIEDECSKEQFQEICKKNPNKMYHHFLFKSNGRLKWMESNKSIETLRKNIKFEYLQEFEIFDTTDSRINIIASKPGMGKSILLKYLKNHASLKYWIVDINLREHFHFFKESPLNVVEYFLSFQAETQKYDNLTLKIRNAFEKRKKLLFLWDGFDELPSTCWKKALEIIESLIVLGYSNWLTTRDYLQRMLEDKFNVFAIAIKEIDEEQQRFYIEKRLKTNFIEVNEREVTQMVNKIIENIKTTGDVSFLGIPLHLNILTELFVQDAEKYIQLLNSTFTLPDLIGYSVEEKFNFFYKNKYEVDPNHPYPKNVFEYYKQCKEAEYELIALKSYLPDEILRNLHFCYAELSKKIKMKSEDIGLIIKTDDDSGTGIFVHNVYGEYFVARWMANNTDLMPNFKNIFFTATFSNIRMIFDMMMAKGCSAHLAVLYRNAKLLRKNKSHCSSKDKAGRSPLHLACSWGEQRPILPVKEEEDKYVIDDSNDNIVIREDNVEHKKILNFLLQLNYDPLEKDDMFQWNCFEYADFSLSLLPLEMLCSKGKLTDFESLQNFKCIHNILYYSIKFGYQGLFKMIKNVPYIETKVNKENLLHLSTFYDRTDYLDRIFENKKYVERINEKNCRKTTLRLRLDIENENGNILNSFVINDSVEMIRVTALHIAAINGNCEIIKKLVDKGANIDDEDDYGNTVLHLAIIYKHLKVVRLLINKYGAKKNHNNHLGHNELHLAVSSEDIPLIKYVMKLGIEMKTNKLNMCPLDYAVMSQNFEIIALFFETKYYSNKQLNSIIFHSSFFASALFFAINNNQFDTVQKLIKYNTNVNVSDENGNTPLHVASINSNSKILELLLQKVVDINQTNKQGQSVLMMNFRFNPKLDVIEFLLQKGSDANLSDVKGRTLMHYSVNSKNIKICEFIIKNREKYKIDIDAQDVYGNTPLIYALAKENLEIPNLLIKNGVNLNVKNKNGISGMHIVAERGNSEILKLLLNSGVSVNDKGSIGDTPLHRAASSGRFLNSSFKTWDETVQEKFVLTSESSEKYYTMVKLLIENNSIVNQCDQFERTPLHYAALSGNLRVVELLIQQGCDLNKTNFYGSSALSVAIWLNNKSVYEFLFNNKEKYSLNVSHKDTDGNNINLYLAVQGNNIDAVKLLFDSGVNFNSRNQKGATILHLASAWGQTEIVQHLLELGAEINVKDNNGQTPLHFAAFYGKLEVVKILIRNGSSIHFEDNFGQTPLVVARMNGQHEVANFFSSLPH